MHGADDYGHPGAPGNFADPFGFGHGNREGLFAQDCALACLAGCDDLLGVEPVRTAHGHHFYGGIGDQGIGVSGMPGTDRRTCTSGEIFVRVADVADNEGVRQGRKGGQMDGLCHKSGAYEADAKLFGGSHPTPSSQK
ncbi:hypothetical protein GCM10010313_14130 [Streptomyces violarus]|nr:hypothetical protein GCM10010313_14130 [Streptomyces violarus]